MKNLIHVIGLLISFAIGYSLGNDRWRAPVKKDRELLFGNKYAVISGFYKGSTAIILGKVDNATINPDCQKGEYYVSIENDSAKARNYLCGEQLK